MLSEREERELELIEQGLRDGGRFAASLSGGRRPFAPASLGRPHRDRARSGPDPERPDALGVRAALQGLLIAGTSYAWWCWKVKPISRKPPAAPALRADRRWWGFPPVY
jgi:hypothetical protein